MRPRKASTPPRRARPAPSSHNSASNHEKGGADARRLLHELNVHQVELKAQNAELREAQKEREAALRLYTDLYTYAPIGYLTLTSQGMITEANRVANKQLALKRAHLNKTQIQALVAPECADSVSALLMNPKREHFNGPLEIQLPSSGKSGSRTLQFVIARLGAKILLAMIDITEIRRLEREVRETVRLERDRLRADLHDGLGQELTGLSLALAALREERNAADLSSWAPKLEQLRAIAANAIATCRTIVHGLSPVAHSGGGLIHALETLVNKPRRTNDPTVEIAVMQSSDVQLDELAAEHVYRIAQEAIRNAVGHGHATAIRLAITVSSQTLTLEVIDNGHKNAKAATKGHGLDIMRYRAREIHGELAIFRDSNGMRVRCTCPNIGD